MTGMTTIIVVATSLFSFLSLLAVLVFLWKVYKHGGRGDLTAAAQALRDVRRPRSLARPDRPGVPRQTSAPRHGRGGLHKRE
ncbi:hypothetical protein OHS58_05745 [Amycolatopsis sp. NBC_00348]|uniref:hypothetical protein n=1 Tax=Amycolatopsis sp. NBC_00348 TaxID=2975956 RepID=UPI002E2616A9